MYCYVLSGRRFCLRETCENSAHWQGEWSIFTFFWCQRQRLWCYHYHILPHINDNMAQAHFTTEMCSVLPWASAAIKGFASRCHTKPNYALHETFLVLLTAPSLQATRCFMLLQCFWNVWRCYNMSISEKHVGSHFSLQTSHTSRENVAAFIPEHSGYRFVLFFNFLFVVVLFK